MSTSSPALASRPTTVRGTTAEQFAPILRVHAELIRSSSPTVDVDTARARIENGQVGYDAMRVVASCGDLRPAFGRVIDAFEVAGLVSNSDRRAILDGDFDVDDIVASWLTGDQVPRGQQRLVARQVAIVIANALLRAASERVGGPSLWRAWPRGICPCCGGSPDIALVERGGARTLVCARCDAQWHSPREKCLGCDAGDTPSVARISNPALGYDLVICNACGRFIKERPRRGVESFVVERALTTELDVAAEQRGLRT